MGRHHGPTVGRRSIFRASPARDEAPPPPVRSDGGASWRRDQAQGGDGGAFDGRRVVEPSRTLCCAPRTARPPSIVRLGLELAREFQRLEPFDRAMTLAAQAFTSIFPLVIATLSFLHRPDAGQLSERLADALGLPSSTRSTLAERLARRQRAGRDVRRPGPADRAGERHQLLARTDQDVRQGLVDSRRPGWSRAVGAGSPPSSRSLARAVLLRALQRAGEGSDAGVAGALLLTFLVNCVLWTWVPSVLLARAGSRGACSPPAACSWAWSPW